jgi:hypothetical protein
LRALQQTAPAEWNEHRLSVAALNSPAAEAVWDNPADATAYDAIPWEVGDGLKQVDVILQRRLGLV